LRYLIGGGALLLVATVIAFFLAPRLVDEERLERRLGEAMEALTGQGLSVAGGIDIKLLPQPLLTVHRPRLGTEAAGFALVADRLDLEVELLPLLFGDLRISDSHLVRPRFRLAEDPARTYSALADQLATRSLALPFQRLGIVGGTVATAGGEPVLEELDGVLERDGETTGSRFLATATVATANGQASLRLEGDVGAPPAGRPLPLQLQLELTADGGVSRIGFGGLANLVAEARGLDGRLTLDLPNPSTLQAIIVPGASGDLPVPLPSAALALEAEMALELATEAPALRLDEMALSLDGQPATGSLSLAGSPFTIALRLESDRVVLPTAVHGASSLPFTLAATLPDGLSGMIELRTDLLEWRAQQLRQVALDLRLDGSGTVAIDRARAVLPGPGDVVFEGSLGRSAGPGAVDEEMPRVAGHLAVALQNPAAFTAAFGTAPAPLRQSTTLSIETEVVWEPGILTLRDAALYLDAMRVEGGVAWRAGADGTRPQLAVRAEVDRLALGDLVEMRTPAAIYDRLLDVAAGTDLAIDIGVERTSLGDGRFGRLAVDLVSQDGEVSVERLSLADIAGSAATMDGRINATSGEFELEMAVDVASLPRLMRLMGLRPRPGLALLGPLNVRSRIEGDRERAEIGVDLEADLFTATGTGRLTDWSSTPQGSLTAKVDAATTAPLVRQLGGIPVTDPLLEGPLAAALAVDLDQGTLAATAAEVSLGGLTVMLDARRGSTEPGPPDRFDLHIGPISGATTDLLYRLATPPLGLVPGPPSDWLGHWPPQALSWDWLQAAHDAELALTLAFADPTLPPLELAAQLRDGLLTVPALRFDSPHGLVEAGLALASKPDGKGADLVLDLAAEGVSTTILLEAIGADPGALAGLASLEARLLSGGDSLQALVGNLEGTAEVVITDGVLAGTLREAGGIPISRLGASLAIDRGVVRPVGDGLHFAGPDGTGRIEGYADLLAWMIDLDLAIEGYGGDTLVRQRFFGPLATPEPITSEVSSPPRGATASPDQPRPDGPLPEE
jgi:hypothetical protein